jgi:MerR family transcriptional regulator, thiopeptide resistance regulator
MTSDAMKVGELAQRTGLTVRTLHHYDEIGLVRPLLHSSAGHRLYAKADVRRLQQVVSLRQLGFSLEEIRSCLESDRFAPLEVIEMHLASLLKQIDLQRSLSERLKSLAEHFRQAEEVSAQVFLETIEAMTMIENYYTPEQLETLRKGREEALAQGVDVVQQGQADWARLLAHYKTEMDRGTDPADSRLDALEARRQQLVSAFTRGDVGIAGSLKRLWTEQGDKLSQQYRYDPRLMEYLGKVAEARGSS